MQMKENNFVEYTFDCGEETLYFIKRPDESWIGFTILDTKFLKKRTGWEQILFEKETLRSLRDFIMCPDHSIAYFECRDNCQVLRIIFEDHYFYFDLFDNYALKAKKGIKFYTALSDNSSKEFIKILDLILLNYEE